VYGRSGVDGALPVCSPPIRDKKSQEALWRALGSGDLQVISTDHCPFTRAEKATGLADFSQIPGGVPSVEMRFPAIYSYGVAAGHITENQWVDLCCTRPAQIAGLERKGEIATGFEADIVVFDPDQPVILSEKILHEKVDWTPYNGMKLKGWPMVTISRGEVLVENGIFHGQPGRGQFVKRRRAS
jgi:dihydropyrimidinase